MACVQYVYVSSPRKQQHYCCVTAVSVGSAMRGGNTVCLLLWLLRQPGERSCGVRLCSGYSCCCVSQGRIPLQLLHQPGERLCHGCRASQERISESSVSRVPQVPFQPLSSHLAYPGSSQQWAQWDTVRQLASGTAWRAIHSFISGSMAVCMWSCSVMSYSLRPHGQ